jgi:hypothetical protein
LSRTRDGLIVSEVDLNHCRQVRDKWGFQMTQRLPEYAEWLTAAAKPDFKPQVIVDPGVNLNERFEPLAVAHRVVPRLAAPSGEPVATKAKDEAAKG